jgi:hypothetical protein
LYWRSREIGDCEIDEGDFMRGFGWVVSMRLVFEARECRAERGLGVTVSK